MQSITIGSDAIQYKIERGTVVNVESHSETTTSGYSGGVVINGTMQSRYEKLQTVFHQKIYFKNGAGQTFVAD